ncbi:MAG: aldo/keto reductase, partial [Calditrichota bacterium]
QKAAAILKQLGTPCLIHQPIYNMFDRWIEKDLLPVLEQENIGCIVFSPLAQGLLTEKYLNGIPEGSRASRADSFLAPEDITDDKIGKVRKLNDLAKNRGQTLAQMTIAWVLRLKGITSVLVGASRVKQITDNVAALTNLNWTDEELRHIDEILL